jgi:hypothetical protein
MRISRLPMFDTPTFNNLLCADVAVVDRGKEVEDHMLYMILS